MNDLGLTLPFTVQFARSEKCWWYAWTGA